MEENSEPVFVALPADKELTREQALEMGYALADALLLQRLEKQIEPEPEAPES